jgi:hypothetical protein
VIDTSDLNLGTVNTASALAAALRQVHVRAGKPTLRPLEARTRHQDTPLSKTVVSEMLRGTRFPTRAVMIAFLRACDVQDASMESWQRTWERVAGGIGAQNPQRRANLWHFSDQGPVTLICAQLPQDET